MHIRLVDYQKFCSNDHTDLQAGDAATQIRVQRHGDATHALDSTGLGSPHTQPRAQPPRREDLLPASAGITPLPPAAVGSGQAGPSHAGSTPSHLAVSTQLHTAVAERVHKLHQNNPRPQVLRTPAVRPGRPRKESLDPDCDTAMLLQDAQLHGSASDADSDSASSVLSSEGNGAASSSSDPAEEDAVYLDIKAKCQQLQQDADAKVADAQAARAEAQSAAKAKSTLKRELKRDRRLQQVQAAEQRRAAATTRGDSGWAKPRSACGTDAAEVADYRTMSELGPYVLVDHKILEAALVRPPRCELHVARNSA